MAWKRLLKEQVDEKTGLAFARYMKGLGAKITKLIAQMEKSPTKKRAEALADLEKHFAELNKPKVTTGRRPSGSKEAPAQKGSRSKTAVDKRIKELKEKAAETGGKTTTREQRAKIRERLNRPKKGKGKGKDTGRTLTFTPEGEKLWETNTEASLDRLLKNIDRYTYPGGRQALKPKTIEGTRTSEMPKSERIMKHMKGEDVPLTPDQIQDAMRAKGAGTAPTEKELLEMGGFEVFKKGGYKKFQGRSKLGSKEHIYAGGGSVSDISHFRKKKK